MMPGEEEGRGERGGRGGTERKDAPFLPPRHDRQDSEHDVPTYLPTLEDYRSLHLSIRSRSFLRAGSRCASRIDPDDAACRIQILDSDSGLTVAPGRASLANPTECGNVCLLCISLFSPGTNRRMRVSKILVHAFNF